MCSLIDTIDGMANPWLKDDLDKQIDLSNGEIQKTPRKLAWDDDLKNTNLIESNKA